MTEKEARALLHANRRARGVALEVEKKEEGGFGDEGETKRVLGALKDKLAELVEREIGGKGFFVKLADRSPKDATNLEDRVRRLFDERRRAVGPPDCSNFHLQCYVWARCHALRVTSAEEAMELLLHSERVCTELTMKLESAAVAGGAAAACGILLREFDDNFDPAFEFRAFVHGDKLTAMSQMATMDIVLHYPHVISCREQLQRAALEDGCLADLLRGPLYNAIVARGPSDKYVIDLYFDRTRGRYMVVELNPFQTSSSGHLFRYWDAKDAMVLSGQAPFEFRLHSITPHSALEDVPPHWRLELLSLGDLYSTSGDDHGTCEVKWIDLHRGDLQDTKFAPRGSGYESHSGGAGGEAGGTVIGSPHADKHVWLIIVAGGKPDFSVDLNREETEAVIDEALARLSAVAKPEHIVVLASSKAQLDRYRQKLGPDSRLLLSTPDALLDVLDPEKTITGCNNSVLLLFFGHGDTDHDENAPEGSDYIEENKRGHPYFFRKRLGDSERWWLQFPQPGQRSLSNPRSSGGDGYREAEVGGDEIDGGEWTPYPLETQCDAYPVMRDSTAYSLHWHSLMRALVRLTLPHRNNRAFLFVGACYSGGLFRWLPDHSNNSVAEEPRAPLSELQYSKWFIDESHDRVNTRRKDITNDEAPAGAELSISFEELSFALSCSARRGMPFEETTNGVNGPIRKEPWKLPLCVITSSDCDVAAGTWAWHVILKLLSSSLLISRAENEDDSSKLSPLPTFRDIYDRLRRVNPLGFSTGSIAKRGEASDAAICSIFYADADLAERTPLAHLFPCSLPAGGTTNLDISPQQQVESDMLDLFESGADADIVLVLEPAGASFAVHSDVLSARSSAIETLLRSAATASGDGDDTHAKKMKKIVRVHSADVSEEQLRSLLKFIYAGVEGRTKGRWDTDDWNSLIISTLSLAWDDLTDALIVWREQQTQGKAKAGAPLRGDISKRVIPGWKKDRKRRRQTRSEKDEESSTASSCSIDEEEVEVEADSLTFSFEFEGNSLHILRYYRPEFVTEDEWLSLSASERWERIGGNWARLKRRIDRNAFSWMNSNLTIEDAGFVWEVSYGGETPGYAVDLDHLFECIHEGIDAGLSLGDREMDSGIQAHIAFPFMQDDDAHGDVRETVLCLMVHLDDYLFLREFSRSIIDDCNNLWTNEDVQLLLDTAAPWPSTTASTTASTPGEVTHDDDGVHNAEARRAALEALVTSGRGDKAMPNPRMKHKHVGLRGIDCYKVPCRFGFEIRRGHSVEQLEELMRYLCLLFQRIGDDSAPQTMRLRPGRAADPHGQPYSFSDMQRYVREMRVAPQDPVTALQSLLDPDQVDAVGAQWVERMCQWEAHLIHTKLVLWGSSPTSPARSEPDFEDCARAKVRRRLSLVLCTEWGRFPPCCADYSTSSSSSSAAAPAQQARSTWNEEQQHIRNRLLQVLPRTARLRMEDELDKLTSGLEGKRTTQDQQLRVTEIERRLALDDVILQEVRGLIVDFAARLARLF